jgi:hypothetical protein
LDSTGGTIATPPTGSGSIPGQITPGHAGALLFWTAVGTDVPWSVPSLFEAAAIIGINIFGVVRSFDASGGKSNPDYVAEFTCLYVPVAITTYGTVWGVYWLLRWAFNESILAFSQSHFQFAMNLGRLGTDLFGFLTLLANVISLFIAYERLRRLLARVREAKSDG